MHLNKSEYPLHHLNKLRVSVISANHCTVTPEWGHPTIDTDKNKLYLIENGIGSITILGKKYHPSRGDLILIPTGTLDSYTSSTKAPYTKYWCHFDADITSISLNNYLQIPFVYTITNEQEFEFCKAIFKDLTYFDHTTNPIASLKTKALLLELLFYYFEKHKNNIKLKITHDRMHSLVEYIDNNLYRKITVSELAEHVHLNPNYFSKLFSATFGSSASEYINTRKLEYAKLMLIDYDFSIEEIAYKLGYSSPFYFSTIFKKEFGCPPSTYRSRD